METVADQLAREPWTEGKPSADCSWLCPMHNDFADEYFML